jgi:hypothetical protein
MVEKYVVVSAITLGGQTGPYPVPCNFDFRAALGGQTGPYPEPYYFDFREEAEAYANKLPSSGKPEVRAATWEDIERRGLIFRSGNASREKL